MSDVIALVFDFDDTLAPDSTTGFLNDIGEIGRAHVCRAILV